MKKMVELYGFTEEEIKRLAEFRGYKTVKEMLSIILSVELGEIESEMEREKED